MTTVAEIAAEAFTAVAADVTDVILTATVTKTAQGAYNATTGAYAETETDYTGRGVVATERALTDYFPDYVAGPADTLVYLEGLSAAPAEGDKLALTGHSDRIIRRVGDVVGAGTFFAVVAR